MSGVEQHPFPAPAGMNRAGDSTIELSFTVPRTRGDEPRRPQREQRGEDRSPHPRG